MSKLQLGIMGLSVGNGHPYSWGAIFNGYDDTYMASCPFPVIPQYLKKQNFPEDGLGDLGQVTHIWTQDRKISEHVALASKIEHIIEEIPDFIGKVDAVLLARDDAENHHDMAITLLEAGMPIFIDKPLALTISDAQKMMSAKQYENQLVSCSSCRFAKELIVSEEEFNNIGTVKYVEGSIRGAWNTYAVHVIEPIIAQMPDRGQLVNVYSFSKNGIKQVIIEWDNASAYLKVATTIPCDFAIEFFGDKGNIKKYYSDSFNAFRTTLEEFLSIIANKSNNISATETLEIVKIIELGNA